MLSAEGGKPPGAPVLQVVRGIAQALEILATKEVPQAEERLMRNTQQASPTRHASDLGQGPAGVLEVLEHLQADDEIIAPAPDGKLVHVALHQRYARAASPGVREGLSIQLYSVDPSSRDPLGDVADHDPFAAPYFQDPSRRLDLDEGTHPAEESSDELTDDGIPRPVLRLVVASLNRDDQPSRDRIETSSALRVW